MYFYSPCSTFCYDEPYIECVLIMCTCMYLCMGSYALYASLLLICLSVMAQCNIIMFGTFIKVAIILAGNYNSNNINNDRTFMTIKMMHFYFNSHTVGLSFALSLLTTRVTCCFVFFYNKMLLLLLLLLVGCRLS